VEPEPAKFKSKEAGVGAIKEKWPAPDSGVGADNFRKPCSRTGYELLKLSWLHQP